MHRKGSPSVGHELLDVASATHVSAEPAQTAVQRLVAADVDLSFIAAVLRLDLSTVHRLLRRDRLRYDAADRIAVALGRHPCELWPEWFNDVPDRNRS